MKHSSTRVFVSLLATLLPVFLLGSVSSIAPTASAATIVCGSWQDISGPNVTGQLFGVAALSHNDVWAVGYSANFRSSRINTAVIEHWNGTKWSVIPSPQPGSYRDFLEKVAAISSSNVWAVGAYQSIQGGHLEQQKTLIEHWDGHAWSVVPSPNLHVFSNGLFGITALSSDNIWAMGAGSSLQGIAKTLIEHWNGTRWSIVPTPDPGTYSNGLGSVSALSPSDIWSVGSYSNSKFGLNQTLVEHWNGTQWSVVPSPNKGTLGDGLGGVTAISAHDIWAAGYYAYPDQNGMELLGTMTQHWDGKQWSIVNTPNPPGGDNSLHDVTSLASNQVWAVGTSTGGPIIIHWNGHQWNTPPTPGPSYRWLWSISALSPHDVWSVGSIALKLLAMHYC